MCVGGDEDDAALDAGTGGGADYLAAEQVDEEEVAEVVDAEVGLAAVGGAGEGAADHSGAADDARERERAAAEIGREGADGIPRAELEAAHDGETRVGEGAADRVHEALARGRVAAREYDVRAAKSKHARNLAAERTGRARDHVHATGQVRTLGHVLCGARRAERTAGGPTQRSR